MSDFRTREKGRQSTNKAVLFSGAACQSGRYENKKGAKRYPFCLHEDCSAENLHESIRDEAIEYFQNRRIPWHDGKTKKTKHDLPSSHLLCSQSFCVNTFFPFIHEKDLLCEILNDIGFLAKEVLPFYEDVSEDMPKQKECDIFVCFEWIGKKNYLGELIQKGKKRTRGKNFTSSDFAIRFKQNDGDIHIVLGEWKYSERYDAGKNMRFSKYGTDRLSIYRDSLLHDSSQIQLKNIECSGCEQNANCDLRAETMFYEPFYQLMRLQLLASQMELHEEMKADIVSVLHVSPHANKELLENITSPSLRCMGNDLYEIWEKIVIPKRFRFIHVEDLIPIVTRHSPSTSWAKYMNTRYGNIE